MICPVAIQKFLNLVLFYFDWLSHVASSTAYRSFSKLKIIKTYLRKSMGQNRQSNIAVLNIEQYRIKELSLDKIITEFSNLKAKIMKF